MKRKDKIDKRLNDTFTENFREYLGGKFPKVKFETIINFSNMGLMTVWDTEDPKICAEIKKHAEAYEAAYTKAREEVRRA